MSLTSISESFSGVGTFSGVFTFAGSATFGLSSPLPFFSPSLSAFVGYDSDSVFFVLQQSPIWYQ